MDRGALVRLEAGPCAQAPETSGLSRADPSWDHAPGRELVDRVKEPSWMAYVLDMHAAFQLFRHEPSRGGVSSSGPVTLDSTVSPSVSITVFESCRAPFHPSTGLLCMTRS